jgi:hypothetical protein
MQKCLKQLRKIDFFIKKLYNIYVKNNRKDKRDNMYTMSNNDYMLFKSIVKVNQPTLQKTLASFLKRKYKKVIVKRDYLYAEGDIPVCLAAHMDTVFKSPPKDIYYDKEAGVIWSPDGGCGDDRAGIFAILKIVQSGLRPSIIFTNGEEQGCIGSEEMTRDFLDGAPSNFKYIIQLDRRGTTDCVFYDCNNKNFIQYVESFGFIENYGSFTDISVLCPAWGIAGVNLSIGYENEHSISETLHVNPLYKTISKVKKMLKEENIPEFKYIPKIGGMGYRYFYDWPNDDEDEDYYKVRCAGCGQSYQDFEVVPAIIDAHGTIKHFCPDCCASQINWCHKCGKAFKWHIPNQKLCPICMEEEED